MSRDRRRLARHARRQGRASPRATSSAQYGSAESLEDTMRLQALTEAARAHLAAGHPAAALNSTRRAAAMHRARKFAPLDTINPAAVVVAPQPGAAGQRQVQARRTRRWSRRGDCCSRRIASLSDEGLRRNYLNKREENREIVLAWLAHAREPQAAAQSGARPTSPARSTLSESFERLVDTGLRLNEIKTEAELYEFLVDEVTELSGAERVLLVLEAPDAPSRVSRSPARWCPKARTSTRCCESVTPWLSEARRNRAVSLRHTPDGADDHRRSAVT